jgi:ATP-binding cassette subfamily B protein
VRDALDALRLMLAIMWETNRKVFVAHVFVSVANVFSALLLAFGLRPLIDGTYYHRTGEIVLGGVVCLVATFVLIFGPVADRAITARSIEVMIMVMQRRILTLTTGYPGLDHFERAELWDRMQIVRRSFPDLLMGMFGAFVTPIVVAQLVVASIVLFRLDARLVFLPLVIVPVTWLNQRAQRLRQASDDAVAPDRRSLSELFKLATSAQPAKEVRVYGLGRELVARYQDLAMRIQTRREGMLARAVGLRLAGHLLIAPAYAAAIAIVVAAAVTGAHTPGDVALTLALAAVLIGAAAVSSEFSSLIARAVSVARSYDHLLRDLGPRSGDGREPAPTASAGGFALDGVCFSYAGSDRFALADVCVRLPAGSVVALVGENGAGKTTLVKLLSRMYPPSGGRILLDGRDVGDLDVERYRRCISASFQDFVRFELRARESVGIGDVERLGDEVALRSALARARCEFVDDLPEGLDTQLGREWEGGVELSGGQWQKLAIARGMMRDRALLVIFDEPTAALDPQSEYEIFQQVAAEARAGGSDGRVTLLVSHRFSTVRMADLILVLENGRLVEHGTHQQLMALDGRYAELYRLQARAYAS